MSKLAVVLVLMTMFLYHLTIVIPITNQVKVNNSNIQTIVKFLVD